MLDGGPSIRYLNRLRHDPKNALLLTGYQARNTGGRRLLEESRIPIFGNLTSRDVNEYYKTVVNGLTAKVFRTFSASTVVSKYLNDNGDVKKSSQM